MKNKTERPKKNEKRPGVRRVVTAAVLSVAVAAALVFAGVNRTPDESLSYEQLLALAEGESASTILSEDGTAASDASSGDSELEKLLAEIEGEAESESVAESEASSEAGSESSEADSSEAASSVSSSTSSSSKDTSSKDTSSKDTSSSAHSSSSQAASSHSQSSSQSSSSHSSSSHTSSTAASRPKTKDELCDEKLAGYVLQIEKLQNRSEAELYRIIGDAFDEYMSHPQSERNLMLKISVVLGKSGELTQAQSNCDKEFNAILAEMRQTLKDNGRDQTLADEAQKTYKKKKSDMIKELTDQAYSGGDGSGQSGAWIKSHRNMAS